MVEQVGWAEPAFVLGECRTQMVAGFKYVYAEEKHVAESDVGAVMGPLMGRIFGAHQQAFGEAEPPPLMVMFVDLEVKYYDVLAGFVVRPESAALEGALVMEVPPALCAGVLVWGADVTQSYAPLLAYMETEGLRPVEGWREWYLHWESEASANNISLVQHVAERA